MKNYFLTFLGVVLVAIVAADWNNAPLHINVILATFGAVAVVVGVFSNWRLSPQYPPVYMASYVDGVPSPRTRVRAER